MAKDRCEGIGSTRSSTSSRLSERQSEILHPARIGDPTIISRMQRSACCTPFGAWSVWTGFFWISVTWGFTWSVTLCMTELRRDFVSSWKSRRGIGVWQVRLITIQACFSKFECCEGRKTNTRNSKRLDTLLRDSQSGGGSLGVSNWPEVSFQDSSLGWLSLVNQFWKGYSAIHTSRAKDLLVMIILLFEKPAVLGWLWNRVDRNCWRIHLLEQGLSWSQGSEFALKGPGMCREDLRSCNDTRRCLLFSSAVLCWEPFWRLFDSSWL